MTTTEGTTTMTTTRNEQILQIWTEAVASWERGESCSPSMTDLVREAHLVDPTIPHPDTEEGDRLSEAMYEAASHGLDLVDLLPFLPGSDETKTTFAVSFPVMMTLRVDLGSRTVVSSTVETPNVAHMAQAQGISVDTDDDEVAGFVLEIADTETWPNPTLVS